jgi:uncharacterized protein YndB with AHSA1/START domain
VSTSSNNPYAPEAADLVVERTLNAPRELVWQAFTEPQRLLQWWGPKGFVMKAASVDLRPGGLFLYSMQGPGGGPEMWGKFVYEEILAPEKLVYVSSFSDPQGNFLRHPMSATWPLETLNTLMLREHDGKTTLTLFGGPIRATEEERQTFVAAVKNVQQGMAGTLNQLEEYLAGVA